MSKKMSLKILFDLLDSTAEAPSPDYFLFLLGTNTQFVKRPLAPELSYERGETLSYSAQVLSLLLGEESDPGMSEPHAYSSPSVDVLNGPDSLGRLVGERIAQGLFLALHAVASGKTRLQIAAHSRGAAEAILMMHELERIKIALRDMPEKSLLESLKDTPCALTQTAVSTIFPNIIIEDTLEKRTLLSEKLSRLEINAFLIDPVPGDTMFGIPGVRWHDPRFYIETPCQHYELLLCRDERSSCFYPIIPPGMKSTIIPGHHGTPSGNAYTQRLGYLPQALRHLNTTSIQDLTILKLFYFIEQQTDLRTPATALNVEHPELDEKLNAYLNADKDGKQQQLIEQYNAVCRDDPAYRHFRKTCYLGFPINETEGHRWGHHESEAFESMKVIMPEMQGSIVNIEHARFIISSHFKLPIDSEPREQVECITKALLAIKNPEPSPLKEMIASSAQGKTLFQDSLSMLVESIGQKYLRNHLTTAEKLNLLNSIAGLFAALPEDAPVARKEEHLDGSFYLVELPKLDPFLLDCKKELKKGIKTTIETYQISILEKSSTLQLKIQSFLAVNNPDDPEKMNAYLLALQECFNQSVELMNSYSLLNDLVHPLILNRPIKLPLLNLTLIHHAACMLKEKNYSLRQLPEGISAVFYERVKARAIQLGALSPEQEAANEQREQAMQTTIDQLTRRTTQYRDKLLAEAKQYYPNIKTDEDGELPELAETDPESAYNKIKTKFNIVHALHQQLNDASVIPSLRVTRFKDSIQQADQTLKTDHNSAWVCFVKSCLTLIAIIATGIIPGVVYLKYTGKSLFFNQNKGEKYVADINVLNQADTSP